MRLLHPNSALAAIALTILVSGCHTQQDSIAVIPRTTATLLWEPMHQGIVETAREDGIKVYWNAPPDDGDTEKQMNLYASIQNNGYRGFIFTPDETLAARSAVLETMRRGVPVVIVDDELGPAPSQRLSYVSNDEVAGTMLAAQRIKQLLRGHGSIAVTGIVTKSESSLSRDEEFERALSSTAPDIHIAVRRFGDTVLTHQQQIAQEIILRPDPVDAIVALSAAATRGAYYAKLASGIRSSIAIVGFDQDLLLPLQTGDVDAIVAQNTREIGRVAMRNLDAQMHGRAIEGITYVPPILLTHETIGSPATQDLFDFPLYNWSGQ